MVPSLRRPRFGVRRSERLRAIQGSRSTAVHCTHRTVAAVLLAALTVGGCVTIASPTPAPTTSPSTATPATLGRVLVVDSPADSGPGTLREALEDATGPALITFDPSVFLPNSPAAIRLATSLPELSQGDLTIDASEAGVVLDGGGLAGPEPHLGLSITSDRNVVRGFQITGFTTAGIGLSAGAQHNTIGGDRTIGDGPLGQGNLISGNGEFGVGLWDEATSHNTIIGNYIGITLDGAAVWGQTRDGIHSNGATQNTIIGNVIGGSQMAGVYLCCALDGRNVITANSIGVGLDGTPLPNQTGVIVDRTRHNVVGPDNTIAHNLHDGLSFWEDAPQNPVTQSRIHDNGGLAIRIHESGLQSPANPILLDFDLSAGTVAGITCPRCAVEFFSDEVDEAVTYEGTTTADATGAFTFDKGGSFAGPHLTAIATDPDGNSSPLADHTSGPAQSAVLQAGNQRPRRTIRLRSPDELVGNYIGDVFDGVSLKRYPLPCTPPEEDWSFAHVAEMGFTWVRLSVDRLEWWENGDTSSTRSMGEYSSSEFNACQDGIISALAENDVTIVHTIVYWDEAVHSEHIPNYRNEGEMQGYLDYARLLARHFKERIQYYGILNEAALFVDVETYINLIRRTVPVIREEHPEAKIVVGGTANFGDPGSRWYLQQILESDVAPLIDVIELHPMYGAAPGPGEVGQYYHDYPAIIGEFRQIAAENGFAGEWMAAELTWSTEDNPDPASPFRFTVPQVAKYYARAIVLHRGLDMWAAVGGPYWMPLPAKVIRNLTTVLDGAEPEPMDLDIQSEAGDIVSYTFALPDGGRLIALWMDGAAVDDDPGVPADLTFPGLSAARAVGIDPLVGIEQPLNGVVVGGDLVIRGFVVRDYPVFVRLQP